jgi:putative phage-type endonuclease
MVEIKNLEQKSQEWLEYRLGKITGTRLKEVLKADNLPVLYEMIAETLSRQIEEFPMNNAMRRGVELEPIARQLYQDRTGEIIEEIGFCLSDENDYLGLSPDGFTLDRKGAIEIKCPSTKTHVKYILDDRIPNEYLPQVCMYFIVNRELEYLDFITYDDRVDSIPIHIIRVTREELSDKIFEYKTKIDKFIEKFQKYYSKLESLKNFMSVK